MPTAPKSLSGRRQSSDGSVEARDQARGAIAVDIVFAAKLRSKQPLFRAYSCEERQNEHCCQQHADARTKSERPAQRIDEQTQVAGVTDDTINTAGHQRVSGLDRHQPAEPPAEHKYRPEPQRPTGGEENDTNPTDSIPIKGPELLPVSVGRQVSGEQADDPKGDDDPAVGTILANAGAQIAATEERDAGQREKCNCKRNQRRMGEKGGQPAPAEDGEPEIRKGRYDGDERQLGSGRHDPTSYSGKVPLPG